MLYLTCPLGLTSNTSCDVCCPFSKDSSLCLYPCSLFSSSTIMTLQQGGDPAPHSRVIVLDMDLAQNSTTEKKKWSQWRVNRRSFYDTFSIQRSGHTLRFRALTHKVKKNDTPVSFNSMFVYCRIWIHSISSESIFNPRDISQGLLKCEGSSTNQFNASVAF